MGAAVLLKLSHINHDENEFTEYTLTTSETGTVTI